jgi:hypothetical protein
MKHTSPKIPSYPIPGIAAMRPLWPAMLMFFPLGESLGNCQQLKCVAVYRESDPCQCFPGCETYGNCTPAKSRIHRIPKAWQVYNHSFSPRRSFWSRRIWWYLMYWYALLIDVYYIAIQCSSRHASIVGTCFVLDDCSLCATLSFRHSEFFRSFGQSPPRFQFHSKPGCSDFKAVCMSLDLLQKIVFVVEIWENCFASSLTNQRLNRVYRCFVIFPDLCVLHWGSKESNVFDCFVWFCYVFLRRPCARNSKEEFRPANPMEVPTEAPTTPKPHAFAAPVHHFAAPAAEKVANVSRFQCDLCCSSCAVPSTANLFEHFFFQSIYLVV